MITYTEKGVNLHKVIAKAGYSLYKLDSAWISSDDVAVQTIIDSYDPLTNAKMEAITQITITASKKVHDIYPFIDPESEQAIGLYNFATDLYLSTIPAGRAPISGRLLEFKAVYDVAVSGIADINAESDYTNCQAIVDAVIVQIESL